MFMRLKVSEALLQRIAEEADRRQVPMNQVIVEHLAARYGDSQLAVVPRKKMGRPRKHAIAG